MFQSKLFKRMFFSYLIVIASCVLLYTGFILFENYQISSMQQERDNEYTLSEISDIIDQRVLDAQNAVQNLRFSSSMKNLYMAIKLGTTIDAYESQLIASEMRGAVTSRGFSLYGITIFAYNSEKAYSSSGVIYLPDKFIKPENKELPFYSVGTVVDTLDLQGQQWYAFNKTNLIYCDEYTYQYGTSVGTICVLMDMSDIESEIKKVLGTEEGVTAFYNGEELFSVGDISGKTVFTTTSRQTNTITFELHSTGTRLFSNWIAIMPILIVIIVVSMFFIWLAYWESKKYYQPIDEISRLVSQAPAAENDDELSSITKGIEKLIGEKNSYREQMLTISPYAGAGMMQAIVNGKEDQDKISIQSVENFLDLKRPYYIVSVVNFAYEGGSAQKHVLSQAVENVLSQTTDMFTTEECGVTYYFKDIFNSYLILNYDEDGDKDELFFNIHKTISALIATDHCVVSMGVDRQRDDITELKEACENAMKALDGVLRDSRGELFFHEDGQIEGVTYYFPSDFRIRLQLCLEKRDRIGVHELLFSIYKKNLDLDAPSEVYRALLDEVHLSIIKQLRDMTQLRTVHLNVDKPMGLITLQEAFDYYDAALISAIDYLESMDDAAQEDQMLDETIVKYVDENFCKEDISLQSLSDRFNVSNKYILLLFKHRYSTTYLQYIQNKRIEMAIELIKEGRFSLADIGTKCGYANQLTFRRNFKSIVGCNPSEYLLTSQN